MRTRKNWGDCRSEASKEEEEHGERPISPDSKKCFHHCKHDGVSSFAQRWWVKKYPVSAEADVEKQVLWKRSDRG
jgi:hypothetical protein